MTNHSNKVKACVIFSALTLFAFVGVKVAYRVMLSKLHDFSFAPAVRSALPHFKGIRLPLDGIVSKPQAQENHSRLARSKNTARERGDRTESAEPQALVRLDPDLKLIGIGCGDTSEARAVIMDAAQGTERLCKVGDPLSGGVVAAISKDRVVIRFPSGKGIMNMYGTGALRAEKTAVSLKRADLEKALENAGAILCELDIRPREGKRMGVEIAGVKAGSFLDELGLRDGDIINEFNGRSVVDPERFVAYYNRLKPILPSLLKAGSGMLASNSTGGVDKGISRNLKHFLEKIDSRRDLSIVVTRNGRRQTITYRIEQE